MKPSSEVRAQRAVRRPARRYWMMRGANCKWIVRRFAVDEQATAVVSPDDASTKWTTGRPAARHDRRRDRAHGHAVQGDARSRSFSGPLARQLFGQRKGISPVEYGAHIGGFVAGLLIAGCMSIVARPVKATGRRATRKDPRTILAAMLQSGAAGHPRRFPVRQS